MNRRRVVAGIGVAALGAYLLLAPIATSIAWSGGLATDGVVELAVPWSASISGAPVEVDLLRPLCPTLGPCPPEQYYIVQDCGASACGSGDAAPEVGSTPFMAPGSGYWFIATPGHHYLLSALPFVGGGFVPPPGYRATPLRVAIVTPWLGGVPGIVALVGAAAAIATGLRAPSGPRTDRLPSAIG